MKSMVKERSLFSYYFFSIITLGIYTIVFWHKLAKDVNKLCEGDGKKTMKYVPAWFLSIPTLSIFGLVWKYKLTERLNDNAERYNLKFSESGALTIVYSLTIIGLPVAHFLMIKNFNKMAKAYNDYNGLVDPDADKELDLFADDADEEIELVEE